MDLGPLRDLVRDLNFNAHGVEATVTRPSPLNTPVTTRVIWMTPTQESYPGGPDLQRREARRVIAVDRSDLATLPRGTVILAAERSTGSIERWRVEGPERMEVDNGRYVVVADPL